MSSFTPIDSFGRSAMLGSFNERTVPVKVSSEGSLIPAGYRLLQTVRLDLSVPREKERLELTIDSFAVAVLKGSFFMHVGGEEESLKCTIDKCMSVDVSASEIYISNENQVGGFAEIWFFTI